MPNRSVARPKGEGPLSQKAVKAKREEAKRLAQLRSRVATFVGGAIAAIVTAVLGYWAIEAVKDFREPLEISIDLGRTPAVGISDGFYVCPEGEVNCPITFEPIFVVHNKKEKAVVISEFDFVGLETSPRFRHSSGKAVRLCMISSVAQYSREYDGGELRNPQLPPAGMLTIAGGETMLVQVHYTLQLGTSCDEQGDTDAVPVGPIASRADLGAAILGRQLVDDSGFSCDDYNKFEVNIYFTSGRVQSERFFIPMMAVGDLIHIGGQNMRCIYNNPY